MMKVGVMLRHLDQHGGGVLVYTENLLERLPALAPDCEFVFIYANEAHVGRYGGENVRETVCRVPTKLAWDQVGMLREIRHERFDVLFNPKYSLPLLGDCPAVFVCHGLDWYVMPRGSRFVDRLSHRFLMPRYAARADGIVAVSETTKEHLIEYLGVAEGKIRRIYLGVDERFRRRSAPEALEAVKERYQLPERFLLYVGQIYPPKNFGRLLRGYATVAEKIECQLVIAGSHTWLCEEDLALIEKLGIGDRLVRPGWIGREELPAFYQLARALVMPSLYESYGIPLVEAMASGCPVLTSNRYGTREIVGDAGLLVDPEDVTGISNGMERIATDEDLREELMHKGYARAARFTWDECARETYAFLRDVALSR